MLLPYEYEFSCISCGYIVIKWKNELNKIQRRKTNFINRLKYAEHKIFCICIDVYTIYEVDHFDRIFEVLSTLKYKNLKTNKILNENYKDMNDNPDFEQDYWSRTAIGIHEKGQDSIRLIMIGHFMKISTIMI